MYEYCTAIVLAAGQGKRMGSRVQKQFMELKGKPILWYSLACMQAAPWIREIILVTGEESLDYCQKEIVDAYSLSKVRKVVKGGKERYDSVYEGLRACAADTKYVFIHDGARPLITQEILQRAYESVCEWDACVVGMPVKDTIKIADAAKNILNTPNRQDVWMVQTPQVFSYPLIYHAHKEIRQGNMEGITDDAMILEQRGTRIHLVEGSYENIKITTPEDLLIAEIFLENRVM